jgi:hypothetical protein
MNEVREREWYDRSHDDYPRGPEWHRPPRWLVGNSDNRRERIENRDIIDRDRGPGYGWSGPPPRGAVNISDNGSYAQKPEPPRAPPPPPLPPYPIPPRHESHHPHDATTSSSSSSATFPSNYNTNLSTVSTAKNSRSIGLDKLVSSNEMISSQQRIVSTNDHSNSIPSPLSLEKTVVGDRQSVGMSKISKIVTGSDANSDPFVSPQSTFTAPLSTTQSNRIPKFSSFENPGVVNRQAVGTSKSKIMPGCATNSDDNLQKRGDERTNYLRLAVTAHPCFI